MIRLAPVLESPWTSILLLVAGLLLAGVVAPLRDQELEIVRGTELALLAVARMALRGQLEHFFGGLILLGLAMPLVAGATHPLYYSRGFRIESFLEMAGIMLVPGLGVAALGVVGVNRVQLEGLEAKEPPAYPRLVAHLARGTEWALALVAATLAAGAWNDGTVAIVALAGLGSALAVTAALVLQSPFTRREIGLGLAAIGALFAIGSLIVLATGGGRTTEAILGVPPGLLLVGLGLGFAASGKSPAPSPPALPHPH